MPRISTAQRGQHEFGAPGSNSLALLVVVVAALYFGREIFVPLALAPILSFALSPPVSWMRRRRVPRVDRKCVATGKSVSVRVDLCGRRIIKQHIPPRFQHRHSLPHSPLTL